MYMFEVGEVAVLPVCKDDPPVKERKRSGGIPVRAVCNEVLRHRIGLSYEAEAENVSPEQIIAEVINAVEVP